MKLNAAAVLSLSRSLITKIKIAKKNRGLNKEWQIVGELVGHTLDS